MFYFKDVKGLNKEAPLEAFKISYVVLNICSFIRHTVPEHLIYARLCAVCWEHRSEHSRYCHCLLGVGTKPGSSIVFAPGLSAVSAAQENLAMFDEEMTNS